MHLKPCCVSAMWISLYIVTDALLFFSKIMNCFAFWCCSIWFVISVIDLVNVYENLTHSISTWLNSPRKTWKINVILENMHKMVLENTHGKPLSLFCVYSIAAPAVSNSLPYPLAFAVLLLKTLSTASLKLTASSRPTTFPNGSAKCVRFGHWLTLCTLNILLLTYLLILWLNCLWLFVAVDPVWWDAVFPSWNGHHCGSDDRRAPEHQHRWCAGRLLQEHAAHVCYLSRAHRRWPLRCLLKPLSRVITVFKNFYPFSGPGKFLKTQFGLESFEVKCDRVSKVFFRPWKGFGNPICLKVLESDVRESRKSLSFSCSKSLWLRCENCSH